MKRACLSGKDIADLLNGECVKAGDVEFLYDGDGVREISTALDNLKKKASPRENKKPPLVKAH